MTEVISFLKQKEALGLRSVNRFFAKLVYRSPTVKKNMIFRKGKAFESFSKRVLPQNISFLLNLQKLSIELKKAYWGKRMKKINFPSKLKDLSVKEYNGYLWKEDVLPPLLKKLEVSNCKYFGFNKKVVFPSLLKELKVSNCKYFGSKEVVFPPLVKKLEVSNCKEFGLKKVVFSPLVEKLEVSNCYYFGFNKEDVLPPLLKELKVSGCCCFGFYKVVSPALLKELEVSNCFYFGRSTICISKDLEDLRVKLCDDFNEKQFLKNWKNGKFPNLQTYNNRTLQKWKKLIKERGD